MQLRPPTDQVPLVAGIFRVCPLVLLVWGHRGVGLPVVFQPPVQFMQADIGQNRRGQAALGRPGIRCRLVPVLHDARLQHLSNEIDKSFILDAFAQAIQNNARRDAVDAVHQIAFDHPPCPGSVAPCEVSERLDRASSWPEAVRAITKAWFGESFEHLRNCRLYHPIPNGRDAARALFPVGFGNMHPSHWLWVILAVFEGRGQLCDEGWVNVLLRLPIHAWRPCPHICAYAVPCRDQKGLMSDKLQQVAEAFRWVSDG